MPDEIKSTNSLAILKRRLTATVILLNLLVYTLAGLSLYHSRMKDEKQAVVTTQNLASVLDHYIEGEINAIDMALLAVKFEAERQITSGGIKKGFLGRYMARQHSYLQSLHGLRMTDARGDVRYGTGGLPPGIIVNNSDRDFFVSTRDNPDGGIFFSKPVMGRVAGKWVIHIARRVNNPDGSFAGAVYGSLALDHLIKIFSAIDVGTKGTVSLRDGGLGVIARYSVQSGGDINIGNKQVAREFSNLIKAGDNNGTFTARDGIDSTERVYSYRRIAGFPLFLSVGLASEEYLADWRIETMTQLAFVALITLVTLASSRMLFAMWKNEKAAEKSLRCYARRLVEIEEELRRTIAAELHDEIGRDLTVLGMNMVFISTGLKDDTPKELVEKLEDSGRMLGEISRTVRGIMAGLRPPVLDDYGLPAAIRWHAELFSKRTGIAVSVHADEQFPRLKIEAELAIFRISQEALMNVAKHADTQCAMVMLKSGDGMVRFVVVDEGNGFNTASSTHVQNGYGWGVKIMRERAEAIGGSFSLDSVPETGTAVSVSLPMEEV